MHTVGEPALLLREQPVALLGCRGLRGGGVDVDELAIERGERFVAADHRIDAAARVRAVDRPRGSRGGGRRQRGARWRRQHSARGESPKEAGQGHDGSHANE